MDMQAIWNEVAEAATKAANDCVPQPMGVYSADIFGKQTGPVSIVDEGLCGFAWVRIKPARGAFIKFLKDNEIGVTSCMGGYMISMSLFTHSQSFERKEAAARAAVSVLKKYQVADKIWVESRLD